MPIIPTSITATSIDNPVLQTADATSAINIILSGGAVPATHTAPSALTMAPYASELNDDQVAAVVNFIQSSWGNHGGTVTASQVAKVRKVSLPVQPVTAAAFAAGRAGTPPKAIVRPSRISEVDAS